MKTLFISFAVLVSVFAGVTLWALEWDGVATIHTSTGAGSERETRVWYVVAEDGAVHVEAGSAVSPWLADIRSNAVVGFESAHAAGRYVAGVEENPDGHERIRAELRRKYGLRDAWVGLLVDTSSSSMVVLTPTR